MRRVRLELEYDGTHYHGWQLQPNAVTIQQVLETALSKITGKATRVVGAGRTDAGVHALGQVAHLVTECSLENSSLFAALNSLLPEDIAVTAVSDVTHAFHARKSAERKRYDYWIWNDRTRSAFSFRCGGRGIESTFPGERYWLSIP